MASTVLDIAAELARLDSMSLYRLRGEWARLHRRPAPQRFGRDLLIRAIAYRLQERALGGLSKSQLRKISTGSQTRGVEQRRSRPKAEIKPGTRLVREWHGVTHIVLVLEDGVEWKGKRFRSLSVVAREITGAHWSGPRFFGLQQTARKRDV
jgi:hypothetical protein